jgi:response regulator NasT
MRVLVAEDEPVIALALVQRLRALGHEPIGPAADGDQAVAMARASEADVYLFDIELPGRTGLAAADELAREGRRRPVVVITGVTDPTLIDRSVASGVSAYLTKPIDDRELDAALKLATARQAELDAAHRALDDRKLVERAKGLLMTSLRLQEPEAHRRLQVEARRRNLKLAEVARRVVEQRNLLEPPASTGSGLVEPSLRPGALQQSGRQLDRRRPAVDEVMNEDPEHGRGG